MESFLLFCNTVLMALIVVLTIMDQRRRAGTRATNPFRPADKLINPRREEADAAPRRPSRRARRA